MLYTYNRQVLIIMLVLLFWGWEETDINKKITKILQSYFDKLGIICLRIFELLTVFFSTKSYYFLFQILSYQQEPCMLKFLIICT